MDDQLKKYIQTLNKTGSSSAAKKASGWNSSGSGSGSGNTGNNGTGAGGSYTGYSETPDVKAAKENITTGNFGSTQGAGTFGDYLSWSAAQGNNTLGMTGDQMVGMAGVAGTDKDSKAPAGPTLADYQEAAAFYDQLYGGKSTSDIIDYYMNQDAGAYEQDQAQLAKGQAYLSSQYQSAADNKDSIYSQDVATRISENLNDPENIMKYVYEQAEKYGWTQDQIDDVTDFLTSSQKGNQNGDVYNYGDMYKAYSTERKEEEAAKAAADEARAIDKFYGGNGIIQEDKIAKKDELDKYVITEGATVDGMFEQLKDWMDKEGATLEQAQEVLSMIDTDNETKRGIRTTLANDFATYIGANAGGDGEDVSLQEEYDSAWNMFYGENGAPDSYSEDSIMGRYDAEAKANGATSKEQIAVDAETLFNTDLSSGEKTLDSLYAAAKEAIDAGQDIDADTEVYNAILSMEDGDEKDNAFMAFMWKRLNDLPGEIEDFNKNTGDTNLANYKSIVDKAMETESESEDYSQRYGEATSNIVDTLKISPDAFDDELYSYVKEIKPGASEDEIAHEVQKIKKSVANNGAFSNKLTGFVGFMIKNNYLDNGGVSAGYTKAYANANAAATNALIGEPEDSVRGDTLR